MPVRIIVLTVLYCTIRILYSEAEIVLLIFIQHGTLQFLNNWSSTNGTELVENIWISNIYCTRNKSKTLLITAFKSVFKKIC